MSSIPSTVLCKVYYYSLRWLGSYSILGNPGNMDFFFIILESTFLLFVKNIALSMEQSDKRMIFSVSAGAKVKDPWNLTSVLLMCIHGLVIRHKGPLN
jgi:hypothetical protein